MAYSVGRQPVRRAIEMLQPERTRACRWSLLSVVCPGRGPIADRRLPLTLEPGSGTWNSARGDPARDSPLSRCPGAPRSPRHGLEARQRDTERPGHPSTPSHHPGRANLVLLFSTQATHPISFQGSASGRDLSCGPHLARCKAISARPIK
ncbi:hypothetical protein GQ53DRAFT_337960 [Thozetella sp. PMI_491]|nr:hypothetical protein GQ53DRAFT_337960 [Thozetella sp. PMI_491]